MNQQETFGWLVERVKELEASLAASEASAEELRRKDEAQRELIASLTGKLYAAEASAQRLTEALRKIAGIETGMGVHRPCCARGQAIARAALDEAQKVKR